MKGVTVIHKCRFYVHSPRADSSDFGLLGEKSSPKWKIPCPGRQWTTVQNLTPLAYPRLRIHNRTKLQTNNKRYIHTLPIGMCG